MSTDQIVRPPEVQHAPEPRHSHRWLAAAIAAAGLAIGGGIAGGLVATSGSTTAAQDTVATAPVTPVIPTPVVPAPEPTAPAEATSASEYLVNHGYTVLKTWTPEEFAALNGGDSGNAAELIDGVAGGVNASGDVAVVVDLSPTGEYLIQEPGAWEAFVDGLNSGGTSYSADLDGGFILVRGDITNQLDTPPTGVPA